MFCRNKLLLTEQGQWAEYFKCLNVDLNTTINLLDLKCKCIKLEIELNHNFSHKIFSN